MPDNYGLIDAETLAGALEDNDTRVVDCRFNLLQQDAGHIAYLDAHIPGASYADLDRDLAAPVGATTGRHPLPDPRSMASTLGKLGIDNTAHVVVYDDASGAIAARLWWLLRWLGHDDVRILDGGWAHWIALDLPIETGQVVVPVREFHGTPKPERVLTTEEVIEKLNTPGEFNLLDARDELRYRGAAEPIDAVAGHIPGTSNMPFSESLGSDGRFKSGAELRALWESHLGDDFRGPWSVMCGSGVTACHLALSGLRAGLREPQLYVGSWSEWIRDRSRPVATIPEEDDKSGR